MHPPEAEETETFKFPETEKISPPILQLNEATFGYTTDKVLLKGINIDVGLDSRIAVVGPNGAGKSTLVKLLTGETEPQEGSVYKHPALRIGYVSQHATHHIGEHLCTKTSSK